MAERLVVVGGGQAAFSLVSKLRALGDSRSITILSVEDVAPYQRPPLSKKYLLGGMEFERLLLRPVDWYVQNNIELRLSTFVEEIDPAGQFVRLQDGSNIAYDYLVLATGSTPRRLPSAIGGDLRGVHVMRDKRDADLLMDKMNAGRRLLVIGGGYIGLEAAAVARHKGMEVTLIEMADRILQRVAAPETAEIIRTVHLQHGVVIKQSTGLVRLTGENGVLSGAELSDGTNLHVDLAIVGIGVAPNDELARRAGLNVANGIVVDEFARTSDSRIFAVGDCVMLPWRGELVRLESVQNAVDQAEVVAANLSGQSLTYQPKPWFWSDQYDVKLQIAGFNRGYDEVLVRPGARQGAISVWYFRGGRFAAVDAINDAKAYVTGKKLLDSGIEPDRGLLADPSSDLKQLLSL
ncbi:NAD(P)/FAD-dependent oxidoreductase [Rhizobium oryzicola]|uniref:FAD-dependent oxidoreductase n=1 Tax=Rhizobium oryzicola TaxID=1232668 RepID=A0ABT8SU04_9HYPH|nr:FAD-dependent oxidoreductase [Rhizobium oryzicola]MDO1581614.1 FAD-dependent oxidoreductase [Rhizobium oryzicola]